MPYFTDMRAVFGALPEVCAGYDWLISDLECTWLIDDDDDDDVGTPDKRLAESPVLISGDELLTVIQSRQIQFAWAVFTALPKGAQPQLSEHTLPFADGNRNLWLDS